MSDFYTPINLMCSEDIKNFAIEDIKNKKVAVTNHQVKIIHELPNELLKKANDEFELIGFPKIWYLQSYIRSKDSLQGIHIDGSGFIVSAAINIPVSGTIRSKHAYYSGDYSIKQITTNELQYYNVEWKTQPIQEEVIELTRPMLLRVDRPHRVAANGVDKRWIVTIRFCGNPMYEELSKKYENYIKSIVN